MNFQEHTIAALDAVEQILAGGKYCWECRAMTNHRAEDHEEPEDE